MKALFTVGGEVPIGRVISDHRRWLVPLGAVLVINLGVLAGVVLPLGRSVDASGQRAAASTAALVGATADLENAEATRDSQSQASQGLDRFYQDVLPADIASARRITVKLNQMAREHDVTFERGTTVPEAIRGSDLERLKLRYQLSGDWEDIRRFIHAIETAPDFVVIDNVVLGEGSEANAPLTLALDLSTFYRLRDRVR